MIFDKYIVGDKTAFIDKVFLISSYLKINPLWLFGIMFHESRLNPAAVNPDGGASGLIGFMPSTAAYLGTNIEAIRSMNAVDQLDYVYKYFKPYAGKFKTAYDLFSYCFFQIAVGKPDDWIFQNESHSAANIAAHNKIFDLNKDSKITMEEYKRYLDAFFKKWNINPLDTGGNNLTGVEILANPVKAYKGLTPEKKKS
jgi:hypothetical protein